MSLLLNNFAGWRCLASGRFRLRMDRCFVCYDDMALLGPRLRATPEPTRSVHSASEEWARLRLCVISRCDTR
jgi:hypothetical protein